MSQDATVVDVEMRWIEYRHPTWASNPHGPGTTERGLQFRVVRAGGQRDAWCDVRVERDPEKL